MWEIKLFYTIFYHFEYFLLYGGKLHAYTSCVINALPEIVYKGCNADNSLEVN